MANWRTKVKFRDLLEQYDTEADDELKEVKRVKPLWKARFESYPVLKHFVTSLEKIKTEAAFNKWLNTVYDYCDNNLIWIEL